MKHFYITTPLYYVNDRPHLGTAYATIMTDIINRYHKLFGEKTLFLTGTDEHGQKCQEAADKRGMSPQAHCDDMVGNFVEAWRDLGVEYDIFYRTTSPDHAAVVQGVLSELHQKGDIYQHTYEGWYSVSEEIFYTEKDLVDGKSPEGNPVQRIAETNYFFRMSKYQQALIEHIEKHPGFIQPESRRNEVLGFLRKPLNDLCISRPKSRMAWGIEIPFDKDYVTYVWFDALLNYTAAVGLRQDGKEAEFNTWWNSPESGATHILGKDIITTHAVYWPTMLMALGVRLPKVIFGHGWILDKDKEKMSKSKGNVINPLAIKDVVGVDGLRYFFAREIHFGNDAPFSQDLVIQRVNNELANNLGNLLSRTTNLILKYFSGKIPAGSTTSAGIAELKVLAEATAEKLKADIERFAPSYALEHVVRLLNEANRYLEDQAPWKLAKEDLTAAGHSLTNALECVRIAALLLRPVMPSKMEALLKHIHCEGQGFSEAHQWQGLPVGAAIEKPEPLFPRVELPIRTE